MSVTNPPLEMVSGMSVGDIVYLVAKGQQALTSEQFASICRMACEALEMRAMLLEVYEANGPGSCGKGGKEPPSAYAKLSSQAVDDQWDFSDRHLMHKIAKLLTRP